MVKFRYFLCKCGLLHIEVPISCDYCGNTDQDEFKEIDIE